MQAPQPWKTARCRHAHSHLILFKKRIIRFGTERLCEADAGREGAVAVERNVIGKQRDAPLLQKIEPFLRNLRRCIRRVQPLWPRVMRKEHTGIGLQPLQLLKNLRARKGCSVYACDLIGVALLKTDHREDLCAGLRLECPLQPAVQCGCFHRTVLTAHPEGSSRRRAYNPQGNPPSCSAFQRPIPRWQRQDDQSHTSHCQ